MFRRPRIAHQHPRPAFLMAGNPILRRLTQREAAGSNQPLGGEGLFEFRVWGSSRMLLYLVRHGESSFNAEGRIQGQLNTELSPFGQRQGHALAARLATPASASQAAMAAANVAASSNASSIDAIYCSPLSRALATAQPLAEALRVSIRTDDRLMEINAGIFQGLTWPEIADKYPDAAAGWKSHDPDFRIPGGESRRDLMRRAEAVLRSIREAAHERVVVVAHGGVLSAGLKALLGVPAERNPFVLYNGSISLVDWTSPFKLVTLNQTDHLQHAGEDLRSRGGDL
jgi:probable phosphoglycerate mutase